MISHLILAYSKPENYNGTFIGFSFHYLFLFYFLSSVNVYVNVFFSMHSLSLSKEGNIIISYC